MLPSTSPTMTNCSMSLLSPLTVSTPDSSDGWRTRHVPVDLGAHFSKYASLPSRTSTLRGDSKSFAIDVSGAPSERCFSIAFNERVVQAGASGGLSATFCATAHQHFLRASETDGPGSAARHPRRR